MKKFTALAGTGLLLLGSAAIAQDVTADEAMGPAETTQAMPGDDFDAAPAEMDQGVAGADMAGNATYSDAEVQSFAAAALEIQQLEGDAATQEEASAIVAEAGIDPATFNAIGQAMQTDPELAERVQVAAANLQGQPGG